jgi:serine O-acetyltransferase
LERAKELPNAQELPLVDHDAIPLNANMSVQLDKKPSIASMSEIGTDHMAHMPAEIEEDVWGSIRRMAESVSLCEPSLASSLQEAVLTRKGPADMMAAVLSRRLAGADLPREELYALIHETFSNDQCAMTRASADLSAVKARDPACLNHLHVLMNLKGFHALQTHRVAHRLWLCGRSELALSLANAASLVFGIDIHPAARIGGGVMLDHGTGIVIGETSVIEDNVSILQDVTLGGTGKERGDRHPKVRSGVLIGVGAKILGNIEIGRMSKVAAGSVVLQDVPPYSTVAGVPAKVVRVDYTGGVPALDMYVI